MRETHLNMIFVETREGHDGQGPGTQEGPVPHGRVVRGHRVVPWEVTEKPAPWSPRDFLKLHAKKCCL